MVSNINISKILARLSAELEGIQAGVNLSLASNSNLNLYRFTAKDLMSSTGFFSGTLLDEILIPTYSPAISRITLSYIIVNYLISDLADRNIIDRNSIDFKEYPTDNPIRIIKWNGFDMVNYHDNPSTIRAVFPPMHIDVSSEFILRVAELIVRFLDEDRTLGLYSEGLEKNMVGLMNSPFVV